MRLDEWQKYIDSQFLEDEPEPIAAPLSPVKIEAAKTEVAETAVAATEAVKTEPAFTPESSEHDPQDTAALTANLRPETTPNTIQNVVTLVVAAQPIPVLPSSAKPPRFELLTPLPNPPADHSPAPEVTNRTRRRRQASGAASYAAAIPDAPTDLSHFPAIQPVSKPTFKPANEELFAPLTDMDADIPEFHRYLPASHAAAQTAKDQAADSTRPVAASPPASVLPIPSPGNAAHTTPGVQAEAAPFPASLTFPPASEAAPAPALFRTVEITAPEMDALTADYGQATGPNSAVHDNLPRPARSRARHARNVRPDNVPSGLSAAELWATVPRHVQTLLSLERMEESEVAQSSYKRPFQEKRHELIERLLDPLLSLEDTARLLNVCPTTVRRYTNKGILTYYRKEPERSIRPDAETGGEAEKETRQRRFRLSDILAFLETQQAAVASDRQAERRQSRIEMETPPELDTPQNRSFAASPTPAGETSAENGVTFRPVKDV